MKSFIKNINKNIEEVELMLKESMNFYEEDEIDSNYGGDEYEPEASEMSEPQKNVESYIEHIRKYSLNGLSALCDNPDSDEYQMLKKIFQMCDKKPEKKDNMMESYRLFGISKEDNKVMFETFVKGKQNFDELKNILVSETKLKGLNPNQIRLVSENKIIR